MALKDTEHDAADVSQVENQRHGARHMSVHGVAAEHMHEVNDRADMQDIIAEARAAANEEKAMTLLEGLRTYPKAMGWSIALSTCIIMEGYDTL